MRSTIFQVKFDIHADNNRAVLLRGFLSRHRCQASFHSLGFSRRYDPQRSLVLNKPVYRRLDLHRHRRLWGNLPFSRHCRETSRRGIVLSRRGEYFHFTGQCFQSCSVRCCQGNSTGVLRAHHFGRRRAYNIVFP